MKINKEHIAYLEGNYGKNVLPLSIIENRDFPGAEPMKVLIFYKKNTSILKLKEDFFKAAEYYNLFSSRLIMIGDNKFALQYCKDGIEWNELPFINANFDNINIDDIKKMIVPVKTLPGEHLLALTAIPIKDGVFGGISCSHAIGDGLSLMFFLYAWSCIIEDKDFLLPSPQRLFKGSPISRYEIDKVFTPPMSKLSDKIRIRIKSLNIKTYATKEYFSDEILNEIKNKAKSENAEKIISDNQIITSLLLKKYHNHILPDTKRIRLRIPLDLREIHPDIDSLYIGNAILVNITEFTKDEIETMSVPQIAYRLKESITSMRNENRAKKVAYLSEYGIEFKADALKDFPPYNVDTDISSTNLTHFSDLEAMGLSANIGSLVSISSTVQTSFAMMKEKKGVISAQIISRYPLI